MASHFDTARRILQAMRAPHVPVAFAAAILFAVSLEPIAQQDISAEGRRELEAFAAEKRKQNFADWKGIAFYCEVEDPSSVSASRVCENTYTNTEFLAATANVPLVKIWDGYELGIRSLVGEFLILQVKILATKQGSPTAINISIQAYASYSQATEDSHLARKRNDPRRNSRSGDLILWERKIIGASGGEGGDLVQPMSQGVEQLLKQFFADFINARK